MNRLREHLRLVGPLLALLAPPVFATTTSLHPQAVFEGDVAELLIEYDSQIASLYALDTAPLTADFEILDIKSRVFRIDQSASSRHRMQWRLQLLPRRSGRLVVPAIAIGDQATRPLTLEVKPVPDDVRISQDVFVELDSDPRSPYVGQQTLLSMRLLHNTPLRIDGFAEPRMSDAASYRDSEEKVYFVNRDGREFRVLEKQMLIFPRQAGELELPPAVLRGQLRLQADAAAESGLASRKISRSSSPLKLRVREPPAAFSGRYWLPASDLVIAQRLQAHRAELQVGESIDWTLTIEAKGLPAASLPANLLEFETANYTVYADQARRIDRLEDGELIGRLEQRFAIIVTADGTIELPEIRLPWWDTAADRERQARLEGTRMGIVVGEAAGGERLAADAGTPMLLRFGDHGERWLWPLASLAGGGLLVLVAAALRRRFAAALELRLRRWRIRGLLKQACRENRAARARALLIEWGRARWPGQAINGLQQISEHCRSAQLAAELLRLDAVLFSPGKPRWHGGGLWAALAASRRLAAVGRERARFGGLYPD